MEHAKILIVGRGYLAGQLAEQFPQAVTSNVDITNLGELKELFEEMKPDLVFNAAGKTRTGEIEQMEHRAEAYRVNVQGPANLAYLSHRFHFKLVHFSTAMFYDGFGPDNKGWKESDLPLPVSYYTWTKAWADAQLEPYAIRDGILVVRINLPLSSVPNPRNLLTKLQSFSGAVDLPTSITVMEDFFPAFRLLLKEDASGIFHLTNPGSISLYAIMKMMQEEGLIAPEKQLKAMTQEELNQAGGAYQTFPYINTKKAEAFGVEMRPIEMAVRESIVAYKLSLG